MPLTLPPLIAHRGASAQAPENTLIAMKKAQALGARWVEFDVTLTADNVPVIFHDETLERTTNGQGEIALTTWKDLQQLDAGSFFDTRYHQARIPSFESLLIALAPLNLGINIELKPNHVSQLPLLAELSLRLIKKYWQARPRIISSFNWDMLKHVQQQDSTQPLGLLMDSWHQQWQKTAQALHCYSIHVAASLLTAERIAEIKAHNYQLLAYTVNHKPSAKILLTLGVDSIFSDYADLLS